VLNRAGTVEHDATMVSERARVVDGRLRLTSGSVHARLHRDVDGAWM
jgi:hypothetical protein